MSSSRSSQTLGPTDRRPLQGSWKCEAAETGAGREGASMNEAGPADEMMGLIRPRKQVVDTTPSRRIKVVSCGDPSVGKSCLIKRLCEKRFVTKYLATIGIDFGVTSAKVAGSGVKVNFFDMSGHPSFADVREEFYLGTQGLLLVFDVTARSSFNNLGKWLSELRAQMPDADDKVVVVVCANKSDKGSRVVGEGEARLWAENKGLRYFETSAQTGENVNQMFDVLFQAVVAARKTEGMVHKPERPAFSAAQLQSIERIMRAKDNYQRLELSQTATKDEINKAYKRLAAVLHPDKNRAPGADDAFKALVTARTALLAARPDKTRP